MAFNVYRSNEGQRTRAARGGGVKPGSKIGGGSSKHKDANLHDLTNALSAARSYADVILIRARSGTAVDAHIVEALLREIDRENSIIRVLRCT